MDNSYRETSVRSAPIGNGNLSPTYENLEFDSSSPSRDSTYSKDAPTTASTPTTMSSEYTLATLPGRPDVSTRRPHTTQPRYHQEFDVEPSPIINVDDIPIQLQQEYSGIMLRKGKKFNVSLSLYALTWERRRKSPNVRRFGKRTLKRFELRLHDVLGAWSQLNFNFKHIFQKGGELFKLRVFTYKMLEGGKWEKCYYQFFCHSLLDAQAWSKNINLRLNMLQRPRRCHVFVNPFSGEGMACKVYNTRIAHIFQIAGITTTITVTERAGHARDIVSNLDLDSVDALVCIGGDGLFHEVFNSLMWRQQYSSYGENATRTNPEACPIKIGFIPAGSTNALVYCTTGLIDPTTSAMQIAMGREVKVDLISCWYEGQIERFGTSFVGYGFFGDLLKTSEDYRWMGPTRYDFSGVKTMLNLKSYRGRIEFKEGFTSGSPKDSKTCRHGCLVCKEPMESPETGWNVVEDNFVSIDGCVMSCCSPQASKGLSPAAHLGDGCLDLIVHRQASGLRYFKYLANTAFFSKPFTGDLVDVYRVTEFKFTASCSHDRYPGCSNCSTWNIDGEIYQKGAIHVKVHRQLITLLACQPN